MVRVFMGFGDEEHRRGVVAALDRLGPLPDADLVLDDEGGGVLVECHGYDVDGAQLLVQQRLWAALAGTGIHPDSVCLLTAPPQPGEG